MVVNSFLNNFSSTVFFKLDHAATASLGLQLIVAMETLVFEVAEHLFQENQMA